MTLAGFFIFAFEIWACFCISRRYFPTWEEAIEAEIDELIARINLEDMIRLQHHSSMAFLALCIATMGRLFK